MSKSRDKIRGDYRHLMRKYKALWYRYNGTRSNYEHYKEAHRRVSYELECRKEDLRRLHGRIRTFKSEKVSVYTSDLLHDDIRAEIEKQMKEDVMREIVRGLVAIGVVNLEQTRDPASDLILVRGSIDVVMPVW